MVLTKDLEVATKISEELKNALDFSLVRVKIALLNPILWYLINPVYYLGFGKYTIGKAFSYFAHKIGIMGIMIEGEEYNGQKPKWLPSRMPSALARLGIVQFGKIDRFNEHRREIAKIYSEKLGITYLSNNTAKHNYLRFPLIVNPEKRSSLVKEAGRNHIVLGNWYKNILFAPDISLEKLGYKKGDTPNAEWVAERIVNLPTAVNVGKEDAVSITKLIAKQTIIS